MLPLLAVTSLFLLAAPQVTIRTWKSSDGLYSINAEYVGTKDGKVSLRKQNGVVIEVALDRLSTEDQAYVAKQANTIDDGEILDKFKKASASGYSVSEKNNLPANAKKQTKGTFLDVFAAALEEDRSRKLQAETAAKAQKNLAGRSEFTRGLLRGIDSIQATYQNAMGMLSSTMGDETAANARSAKYEEEMRQASENPRLAPTMGNITDDPHAWLAATAGEYSLLTVFCTTICAGVFLLISRQHSKNKSERNRSRGITSLDGNETFFMVRDVLADKVVYTFRNYKIFYFCILPLLIISMAIPVIGLLPILGWTFYWVVYPRPNRELNQMLQKAQFVATGSKLSTMNPMRLVFSRTDFERIIMGKQYTPPETSQSSTPPALPNTHSNSNSFNADLESLRKKNDELKRMVEATKLAEMQGNDRAALEAENARLMQQLSAGIVSSQRSSDVRPSSGTNGNLVDHTISGVGGWLALLVVGMLVLGPLLSIFRTGFNIGLAEWVAERQNPGIAPVPQWQTYEIMTWFVVGIGVVYSVVSGILLCVKKEPASVTNAIAFLWIGGPVAAFVLGFLIPGISLGVVALEENLPRSIGAIIGSGIAATIWTAYLRKSKRVRNTYYP